MNQTTSLEERMQTEAEFRCFHICSKIGKLQAESLRGLGFEVTYLEVPRFYKISWQNAIVNYTDLSLLDENS